MGYDAETLRHDLAGGITSALVVLPLALAFGVVSGLGAAAGLYGAVAVGFFAAVFGGTKVQISGATAPMAVAMSFVVAHYADSGPEALTIIVLAGLIQILLGVLRVGSLVAYTPYSVVSGFTSGVAIIIIAMQVLPFMGAALQTGRPLDSIDSWGSALDDINLSAFAAAVVTLLVCGAWPRRLRDYVPSTTAALVIGTAISAVWLKDAPRIAHAVDSLPDFWDLDLSGGSLAGAVQPAVMLALIGTLNSLLNAMAADSLTGHRNKPNRELIGAGLGNTVAGLLGGLPGAGAPTATQANIGRGARTQASGATGAAVLVVLAVVLGRYTDEIPLAVLAAILLWIGFGLIDWRFITHLHKVQREHALVMALTLVLTVFFDLIGAVAVGLIAAGLAGSRQFERLQLDSVISVPILDQVFFGLDTDDLEELDQYSARVGLVALRGSFTAASSNKLRMTISADIVQHDVVILDFSDTAYMDDSAALLVEQLIDSALANDTECIVMGLRGLPATSLQSLDALRRVPGDHFVESLDDARAIAERLLDR